MLPLTKSYTTVRAQDISARVSQAIPEFPTVLSDLIGQYAQTDFSGALEPLSKSVNDAELNRAIKEAFSSPECDPQLKVDIIYLAMDHGCKDKLQLLIAELLDSGQDVYLNNTTFSGFNIRLGWLFSREELRRTRTLPPAFGKVHFSGARLSGVEFALAYLPGAIFKGAKICKTELCGAFLYGADFSDTDIDGVLFEESPGTRSICVVDWPDFHARVPVRTDLSYATFANSTIAKADFSGAIMVNTNFKDIKNTGKVIFREAD